MWSWLEKVIGTYDKPLVLTKDKEYKRARTNRGRYKGDDKSTANYNEAWVDGKAPKKKVYTIKGKNYMNDKDMKDWTRISVWTLRLMVVLGFIVAYLVITGRIDLWLG
jgi:hypothetical protein